MSTYRLKSFLFPALFSVLFLVTGNSYSQDSGCKVLMPSISGTYNGKCKNGLAQGKGIALGTDKYEGRFYKGLPQGRGTYTWADGSWYEGVWMKGLRQGKGTMVYALETGDSIVSGYWKQDKYVGTTMIPPYKLIRKTGVVRYSFNTVPAATNDVKISIMIGGRINSDIENLTIATSSGSEYRSGYWIGIQNPVFPLDVKLTYRTWNQIHSAQSDVIFEFTLNDPGHWTITLVN
jgi:hypothetical protein